MSHKKKPARRSAAGTSSSRRKPGEGPRQRRSQNNGGPSQRSASQRGPSERGTSQRGTSQRSTNQRDPSRKAPGQDDSSRKAPGQQASTQQASSQKKNGKQSGGTGPDRAKGPRRTGVNAPTLVEPPKRRPQPPVAEAQEPEVEQQPGPPSSARAWATSGDAREADNAFDDSHFIDPYPPTDDIGMLGIGSPFFTPDMGMDSESESEDEELSSGFSEALDDPTVEMRIREIEERLDGLMASEPHDDLDVAPAPPVEAVAPPDENSAVEAAREVLESNYYRQKWGRGSLARNQEVDEFGMDPTYEERLKPLLEFMFKRYFRVEVEGIRHVPSEGRAVVVANHSGALPFDGVMLREAIRERHPGRADLRWLAEDFSFYLPFLGVALNRIGAVRACPENAERLLQKEHLVGVFPEGAEGIKKLYKNRYRLQRFGRGGFVRLCLKTRSPMIPCAIIGAEETNPILYRFDNLSKLIGLDYLPITPTFPLLGPLGLLPAPTKWRIIFGEPIPLDQYGPEAAQDHVLVGRLAERVRTNINDLLETALRRRKSVWL